MVYRAVSLQVITASYFVICLKLAYCDGQNRTHLTQAQEEVII